MSETRSALSEKFQEIDGVFIFAIKSVGLKTSIRNRTKNCHLYKKKCSECVA